MSRFDFLQFIFCGDELVTCADEALEDAYIALNGSGLLQHFGIAGEVCGKSLHLTGVAPFATPDVVVAYGTSGHNVHYPKAGVNATCHTSADDAMRLEVQNEVGNPHGCIHLSDSALLQNDVVVTKFSCGIVYGAEVFFFGFGEHSDYLLVFHAHGRKNSYSHVFFFFI
jgi:hypothetical protein